MAGACTAGVNGGECLCGRKNLHHGGHRGTQGCTGGMKRTFYEEDLPGRGPSRNAGLVALFASASPV
jgi:hypothetical protein